MYKELITQLNELMNPVTTTANTNSFDAILSQKELGLESELENLYKALELINSSDFKNEIPIQLRRLHIDARIRRNNSDHQSQLYDNQDIDFVIGLLKEDTSDFVQIFIQEAFSHEDIPNKNIIPITDALIPIFPEIQDELRIIKCKALSCEYKNIDAMKLYEYLEMKLGSDDLRVIELSGFIGL